MHLTNIHPQPNVGAPQNAGLTPPPYPLQRPPVYTTTSTFTTGDFIFSNSMAQGMQRPVFARKLGRPFNVGHSSSSTRQILPQPGGAPNPSGQAQLQTNNPGGPANPSGQLPLRLNNPGGPPNPLGQGPLRSNNPAGPPNSSGQGSLRPIVPGQGPPRPVLTQNVGGPPNPSGQGPPRPTLSQNVGYPPNPSGQGPPRPVLYQNTGNPPNMLRQGTSQFYLQNRSGAPNMVVGSSGQITSQQALLPGQQPNIRSSQGQHRMGQPYNVVPNPVLVQNPTFVSNSPHPLPLQLQNHAVLQSSSGTPFFTNTVGTLIIGPQTASTTVSVGVPQSYVVNTTASGLASQDTVVLTSSTNTTEMQQNGGARQTSVIVRNNDVEKNSTVTPLQNADNQANINKAQGNLLSIPNYEMQPSDVQGTMRKERIFATWGDWWFTVNQLKNRSSLEEIRCKPNFFRCMSHDCPFSTMGDMEFYEHLSKEHPGEKYRCSYCLKAFADVASLIKHSMANHKSLGYQCPMCFYRGSSAAHVLLHWRGMHQQSKVQKVWKCPWLSAPNTEISEKHIKPYVCPDCNFHTKNVQRFGLHQAEHPSMSCSYCKCSTSSFNALLQHLKQHGIYDFHCYFCTFASETTDTVFEHISLNHPEKPLQLCSRMEIEVHGNKIEIKPVPSFNNVGGDLISESENLENFSVNQPDPMEHIGDLQMITNVQEPVLIETPKAPEPISVQQTIAEESPQNQAPEFGCVLCPTKFKTKKELTTHMTFSHNLPNLHHCLQCSKCFDTLTLLEKHMADEHNDFTYLCVFCDYTTANEKDMKQHLVDKVAGKYQCNSCNFKSSMQEEIMSHIVRDHPGELNAKSMKCKPDNAILAWAKRYLKVQKNPSKNKQNCPNKLKNHCPPGTCPMCTKKSLLPFELVDHLNGHLQYRPFLCGHCFRCYPNTATLLAHEAKSHSDKKAIVNYFASSLIYGWVLERVYGSDTALWPVVVCRWCRFFHLDPRVVLNHHKIEHPDKNLKVGTETRPKPITDTTSGSAFVEQVVAKPIETENLPQPVEPAPQGLQNPAPPDITSPDQTSHLVELAKPPIAANLSDTEVSNEEESDLENVLLKCSICSYKCEDIIAFKDHYKIKHSSRRGFVKKRLPQSGIKDGSKATFTCVVCKEGCYTLMKLNAHMKDNHSTASSKSRDADKAPKVSGKPSLLVHEVDQSSSSSDNVHRNQASQSLPKSQSCNQDKKSTEQIQQTISSSSCDTIDRKSKEQSDTSSRHKNTGIHKKKKKQLLSARRPIISSSSDDEVAKTKCNKSKISITMPAENESSDDFEKTTLVSEVKTPKKSQKEIKPDLKIVPNPGKPRKVTWSDDETDENNELEQGGSKYEKPKKEMHSKMRELFGSSEDDKSKIESKSGTKTDDSSSDISCGANDVEASTHSDNSGDSSTTPENECAKNTSTKGAVDSDTSDDTRSNGSVQSNSKKRKLSLSAPSTSAAADSVEGHSRYGHKPEPVDVNKIFVSLKNPRNDGSRVKVPLYYYSDVWFKRTPVVVVEDCGKGPL